MQPSEVRTPTGIAGQNFAIEHCRFGRQVVRDGRETVAEVVPVVAVHDHARAHLVGLNAVAVEFHLMEPTVAAGTALAGIALHGEMKWNSGTASGCSGITPGGQLGFAVGLPLRTVPSCAYAQ
jgi:hypothetical protein